MGGRSVAYFIPDEVVKISGAACAGDLPCIVDAVRIAAAEDTELLKNALRATFISPLFETESAHAKLQLLKQVINEATVNNRIFSGGN